MKENYELAYIDYKNGMKYKEIAEKYGVTLNTVKSWKTRKWNNIEDEKSVHTKTAKGKGVHTKKEGATTSDELVEVVLDEPPKKDKRVKRRSGNPNPPNQFTKRNRAAMIHGLRSKFFYDEQIEIMEALQEFDVIDQLWLQIEISFSAIVRAQKIMWVEDQFDHLKEVSSEMSGDSIDKTDYKVVYAHERFESYIKAQTRAFAEHRSLVKQFMDMTTEDDERRLKLEQMQLNINRTKAEINSIENEVNNNGGEDWTQALLKVADRRRVKDEEK